MLNAFLYQRLSILCEQRTADEKHVFSGGHSDYVKEKRPPSLLFSPLILF